VGHDARRQGHLDEVDGTPDAETRDHPLEPHLPAALERAAGSQEYGMEKLFELHAEDRYDLLVRTRRAATRSTSGAQAPMQIEGRASGCS
jgi:hypothetical protein